MAVKVLVVDDDPASVRLLAKHLSDAGHEVLTAADGSAGLGVVLREGPQIIITDVEMPGMNGLQLCQAIRDNEGIGFAYIVVLTAHSERRHLLEAFEAGADDFLAKPFNKEELLARLKAGIRIVALEAHLAQQNRLIHRANAELAVLNQKLELMATTDELTGLINRRESMNRLRQCWAAATRHHQPLSCLVLDVDHFKRVNDSHGHSVGDAVLRETAAMLGKFARTSDIVCRMGGEEFLVISPGTSAQEAVNAGERLRLAVEANTVRQNGLELRITISVGVAELQGFHADPDALLRNADEALYAAKRSGRNRVCTAEDPHPPGPPVPAGASSSPTCGQEPPWTREDNPPRADS